MAGEGYGLDKPFHLHLNILSPESFAPRVKYDIFRTATKLLNSSFHQMDIFEK